ncbi:MAG: hypothetical protein JWP87_3382 [Labilithrix sp.]|nr:hypothetical protein [Labilithrix sp.]
MSTPALFAVAVAITMTIGCASTTEQSGGVDSTDSDLTAAVVYACASTTTPTDGFTLTAKGYAIVLEHVHVGTASVRSIYPLDYPDGSWVRPARIEGYAPFEIIGKSFPGTSSDTFHVARTLTGRRPQGGDVLVDHGATRYACKVAP